jgi:hypothetical protein
LLSMPSFRSIAAALKTRGIGLSDYVPEWYVANSQISEN